MNAFSVNCESFRNFGGWVLETQSTRQIGCGYLMAHGIGHPVADAGTEVDIPAAGRWAVWARTRNWNAVWTHGAAGRFRVLVNSTPLESELGADSPDWHWAKAGEIDLLAGPARVSLHDLTGFNGRCAALWFAPANDEGSRPPPTPDATAMGGSPSPATGSGSVAQPSSVADDPEVFDLVVAGGGMAGCCAALAAARCGAKTLLLQDRDVLGGCNSSEVRVGLGGHIHVPPYPALGRIVGEIQPLFGDGNPLPGRCYEDARKETAFRILWPLPGVAPQLRLGQYAIGVEMDPARPCRIAAILSRDTRTGAVTRIRARNFCDATGDATISRLAGCETMYGREAKDRFGETVAPDKPDRQVMGMSVQWLTRECPNPAPFPDISDWALPVIDASDCDRTCGSWEQETGFLRDMADDAERIRDYATLCVLSNWNWLKNKSPDRERHVRRELSWMSPVGGKRESYRTVGDHVLTERDLVGHVPFPDATATVTWDMDHHFPDPHFAGAYPEPFHSAAYHRGYGKQHPVPYRCLYARDCENLFLAGRCISCSHAAFSAVRVMRTLGMLGEVVGMAAAICADRDATPREVYEKHLDALKTMMEAGVPPLPQFHAYGFGNGQNYAFQRNGKHHFIRVPLGEDAADFIDDIMAAGYPPLPPTTDNN